jgi:archaellum biogenesis ATPase FlaH
MEFTTDVQKLFLEFILQDPTLFTRVSNIYNSENFDKSLKKAAKFIQEHAEQHSTLPDRTQIRAVCSLNLQPIEGINSGHIDWFMAEFENFTKRQELERAILKAADLLEKGEYDPVEKLIKDAVQISLTKDLGTDYFADPRARLMRLKSNNGQVSTGWNGLDRKLYGGFNRGELQIFAGGSGSGKSLFMQNLGCNWTLSGLTGAYITLELSEDLCAMRIDSMITGLPTREIFKDLDDVEMKVRIVGKKSGDFYIKYLPAQSTVNDIRSYVKELQIRSGVTIDFLCVDYLDLLMPVSAKVSPNDLFVKDKYVSEELRNLAKELNVLFVTASQLNRCLSLDTMVVTNGKSIEIGDVKVGDWLESECGPVQVTEVLPIIKQPVFEIVLKSGKKIRASANHKFPTKDGLKTINSGLKVGDFLRSRAK